MDTNTITKEENIIMYRKGMPVYKAPGYTNTASIHMREPFYIIVGDPFFVLSDEEKEFILSHEEGHLIYGHVGQNMPYALALEIEHNCDLVACQNTSLKIGLEVIKKMITKEIRLGHSVDQLNERKAKLEALLSHNRV